MALWTPAEISTDLWLDASDASTITIDTGVSEWRDKSGNTKHATQVSTTAQPIVSTGEIGGLQAIKTDGVNDFLETPSLGLDCPFSLFLVYKPDTLAGDRTVINQQNTLSSPRRALQYYINSSGLFIDWGANLSKTGVLTSTAFLLSEIQTTTTAARLWGNGTEGTTSPLIGAYPHPGPLYIGKAQSYGALGWADGAFAEIIILKSTADTATRQICEGYLAWKWGLQANLPIGHPYKDAAPTVPDVTGLRAILDQPYDLQPYLVRAILEQPYGLMVRLAQLFDQVYGLKILVAFHQYYGDAAQLRRGFDQRYGDAAKLRRKFEQLYGNRPRYRAALEQPYNLHAGLRAGFEQNYSIAEGQIRAILEQLYNIQDKDLLRATLDMLYVLAAGEALVQRFDIEVTCDGVVHNSMSNINVEQDDSSFHMSGDLQLYDEAEALQYRPFASAVAVTVDGWTCQLICGFMREARTPGQTIYVVPLFSRTILLDAPHSRLAAGELSGMASALVATLAAPFTVSWQLVDWFIPAGRLAVNEGDAAISVIRRITEAVGGIIQTDPDGVLICRPEYPVSVDKWETATPDHYLTDQDDFFQVDHAPEMRDGYNLVQVSDQQLTTGGLTLEVTTIDPFVSEVRVYQVPWDEDSIIRLRHSGDPGRVSIVAGGSRIETIADEQVEIVAGSGRTRKPFYHLVASDYREAELGGITIAEDGSVTTATAENTLVRLSYWTRCWLFTVTDHTAEDVQFFPEESAA